MDKKEYLERLKDLHHQEMQIRDKKRELDGEYINSSPMKKFKYGEKVAIVIDIYSRSAFLKNTKRQQCIFT